jgi:hypothetical protein
VISNSESDNGRGKQEEAENINGSLWGVSNKFLWQNIRSFPTSWETVCDVYGPH